MFTDSLARKISGYLNKRNEYIVKSILDDGFVIKDCYNINNPLFKECKKYNIFKKHLVDNSYTVIGNNCDGCFRVFCSDCEDICLSNVSYGDCVTCEYENKEKTYPIIYPKSFECHVCETNDNVETISNRYLRKKIVCTKCLIFL